MRWKKEDFTLPVHCVHQSSGSDSRLLCTISNMYFTVCLGNQG